MKEEPVIDQNTVQMLLENGYTLEEAIEQAKFLAKREQLRAEGKLNDGQTRVPKNQLPFGVMRPREFPVLAGSLSSRSIPLFKCPTKWCWGRNPRG